MRGSPAARGLSLVELLVALAIGVVLAFAATHFLLRSKLSFLQSDELARLRENGFMPCACSLTNSPWLVTWVREIPGASIASSLRGMPAEFLLDTTSAVAHVNDGDVAGLRFRREFPCRRTACRRASTRPAATSSWYVVPAVRPWLRRARCAPRRTPTRSTCAPEPPSDRRP